MPLLLVGQLVGHFPGHHLLPQPAQTVPVFLCHFHQFFPVAHQLCPQLVGIPFQLVLLDTELDALSGHCLELSTQTGYQGLELGEFVDLGVVSELEGQVIGLVLNGPQVLSELVVLLLVIDDAFLQVVGPLLHLIDRD